MGRELKPPGVTQYRITRVVGQGAFGTVYEGERVGEGLSRRVAMKLLNAEHSGQGHVEGRLRDEARMLSLIRHRAIVGVDDLIRVDGAWCVVMEFVDGADLGALLELGPLPARSALQIGEEVASALHAAYSQSGPDGRPLHLVHRDVKPANIRLTPRGEVKLLDFGVARAEFTGREAHTRAAGIGTIVYMAAERFRGEDTHAGDVYALGVSLFELLTGVPPGASAGDTDRRPPGRSLRDQWAWLGGLNPDLLNLLVRMMADEPGDRPTARECARELSELRLRVAGEMLEDWAEHAVGSAAATAARGSPFGSSYGARANSTLAIGDMIGGESALSSGEDAPAVTAARAARPSSAANWVRWALLGGAGLAIVFAVAVGVAALGWSALGPRGADAVSPPQPSVEGPGDGVDVGRAPVARAAEPIAPTKLTTTPSKGQRASPVATGRTTAPSPPPPASAPTPSAPVPAAPAVEAAPAPIAARTGTVSVTGASAGVRLHGADGDAAPGPVAPGSYTATVSFDGGATITVTGIRVSAGRTTRVRCDAGFSTCAVGVPE